MADRVSVNFRVDPQTWLEVKASCKLSGVRLNQWMTDAMNEKLDREQAELIAKLTGDPCR